MSRFTRRYGSFRQGRPWWGFEHSLVATEVPYLERWICYLGSFTLRLHKFYRGDDDRAPHDHPWWFITLPTRSYWEKVMDENGETFKRKVKAWRLHFRPAKFRHVVLGTSVFANWFIHTPRPFYTFVLSGRRTRTWGFWPSADQFIPYLEWR